MKKLFFFLFASMLFCSCSCLLSQIPPKYLYADANCSAALPDYRSQVTVSGGCYGFEITQTPAAGSLLTVTNKSVVVIIKATNLTSRSSQISFTVSMLDTITPRIIPNESLLAYDVIQLVELQDAADKMAISIMGAGPMIDTSKMIVTVSKLNPQINQMDRITRIAATVEVNRDSAVMWDDIWNKPPLQLQSDQIDYTRLVNVPNLWIAFTEFDYVPVESKSVAEMAAIVPYSNVIPWVFDPSIGKMRFLYQGVWHTITSN